MKNNPLIKRLIYGLIAVLVAVFISVSSTATILPFYWEFINVSIDVQTNGDMLVTETQKYVFNTNYNNERYRYISVDKVDEIKDVTVLENNKIISSQTGVENDRLWIRWQHKLNPPEAHTFMLKYRIIGGLHVNDQNTQVYWKAIFADRKAPVKNAIVKVHLPENLSEKVLSFTTFGAPATSRKTEQGTFEFVANQPLEPGQELKVQIIFPSKILSLPQPGWQQGKSSDNSFRAFEFAVLLICNFGVFAFFLIGIGWSRRFGSGGSGRGGHGLLELQKENYLNSGRRSRRDRSGGGGGDGGGGGGGGDGGGGGGGDGGGDGGGG